MTISSNSHKYEFVWYASWPINPNHFEFSFSIKTGHGKPRVPTNLLLITTYYNVLFVKRAFRRDTTLDMRIVQTIIFGRFT